jgi:uncharacterized protein
LSGGASSDAASERIELLDALRAFALAGILQVNIQSFLWGAGDPLGYFLTAPRAADLAVHVLVGTFVSAKFVSIFAFVFGVGAALQWRKLARMFPDPARAQAHYRRRLVFLSVLGIAHGTLLYFGDILTFYALSGLVLLHYVDASTPAIVRALRVWWGALLAVTAVLASGEAWLGPPGDPAEVPLETLQRFAVYSTGTYVEQLSTRVQDFVSVFSSMLIATLPQIVGLFLLGLLAGRAGWLAEPDAHPRVWRAAAWLGIAALPVAALGAWLNMRATQLTPGDPPVSGYLLQLAGSVVACGYVAIFVRWRKAPAMRALIRWWAPIGRMPLSNYVLQSALMGVLLSGWGLAWGLQLRHAELAALAVAIVVLQWAISRAWIKRFGQGPLEALLRYVTYGRTKPA